MDGKCLGCGYLYRRDIDGDSIWCERCLHHMACERPRSSLGFLHYIASKFKNIFK